MIIKILAPSHVIPKKLINEWIFDQPTHVMLNTKTSHIPQFFPCSNHGVYDPNRYRCTNALSLSTLVSLVPLIFNDTSQVTWNGGQRRVLGYGLVRTNLNQPSSDIVALRIFILSMLLIILIILASLRFRYPHMIHDLDLGVTGFSAWCKAAEENYSIRQNMQTVIENVLKH